MACLVVPAIEAVVTTVVTQVVKAKEKERSAKFPQGSASREASARIPFSTKLGWLNKLLWGGSALLAFEHVWHGEIIPVFPFLTAVQTGETAEMLAEMATRGVTMAVLVTAVWVGMLAVSSLMEKKTMAGPALAQEGV